MKKRLLWFLAVLSFVSVHAAEQLFPHIDFVLFVLQGNTLRMERYRLDELKDDMMDLSRKTSLDHTVFSIRIGLHYSQVLHIEWDSQEKGRLNIIGDKHGEPVRYNLLLEEVMPGDAVSQDISLLLFDCVTQKRSDEPYALHRADKTDVSVYVPAADDDLLMDFSMAGSIDAACGFFVDHDLFEERLAVHGKMMMRDALNSNIIVECALIDDVCDAEIVEMNSFDDDVAPSFFGRLASFVSSLFGFLN